MKINPLQAMDEYEDDKSLTCETCSSPSLEDSKYCLHCKIYWEDVSNGLFDDDWRES